MADEFTPKERSKIRRLLNSTLMELLTDPRIGAGGVGLLAAALAPALDPAFTRMPPYGESDEAKADRVDREQWMEELREGLAAFYQRALAQGQDGAE